MPGSYRYSTRYSSLETPNGTSTNISTPPHTGQSKRPRLPHITPIRINEPGSRGLLLMSPAFSSPQPPFALEKIPTFSDGMIPSMGPIAISMAHPVVSQPFSTLAAYEEPEPQKKNKKQKKARRDGNDVGFLLQSSEKPPYSYATLIGMAILSHPDKQLTLSQIYLWISDTFKYYRQGDVGWQNLIRHNLSLNKAFVKGEKSKDGKGHFWLVQRESQDLFLKAKNNKRSLYEEVMEQLATAKDGSHLPLSPNNLTDDDMVRTLGDASHYKINNHTIIARNVASTASSASNSRPSRSERASSYKGSYNNNSNNVNNDDDDDFDDDNTRYNGSAAGAHSESPNLLVIRTPTHVGENSRETLPDRPIPANKNSPFTLSFSCSLNFEFLPVPPVDTGPLLEPLTPGRSSLRTYTNSDINVMTSGNLNKGLAVSEPIAETPSIIINLNRHASIVFHGASPRSIAISDARQAVAQGKVSTTTSFSDGSFSSVNSALSLSASNSVSTTISNVGSNYPAPTFNLSRTPKEAARTPLRLLKTPLSGTMVRKLWQSPSYLEEFYHSPFGNDRKILTLYDDDDMILRSFDSPAAARRPRPNLLIQLENLQSADVEERE